MMRVTYLGHSGFLLEMEDALLLFDYYQAVSPKWIRKKHLFVFVSHVHYDHYNPDIFEIAPSETEHLVSFFLMMCRCRMNRNR